MISVPRFFSVNLFVNSGASVSNAKAGSPVSDDLLNRGIDIHHQELFNCSCTPALLDAF